VKILTPRRDVAPNLFIVDVDVHAAGEEGRVLGGGEKIFTRKRAAVSRGARSRKIFQSG